MACSAARTGACRFSTLEQLFKKLPKRYSNSTSDENAFSPAHQPLFFPPRSGMQLGETEGCEYTTPSNTRDAGRTGPGCNCCARSAEPDHFIFFRTPVKNKPIYTANPAFVDRLRRVQTSQASLERTTASTCCLSGEILKMSFVRGKQPVLPVLQGQGPSVFSPSRPIICVESCRYTRVTAVRRLNCSARLQTAGVRDDASWML